jgi:hypothetical protein
MHEQTAINTKHFDGVTFTDINNSTTKTYYTISDLRRAIKTGEICTASDLTTAYITLYSWAKYPFIDFSLMLFIPNSFNLLATPADTWAAR